MAQTQCPECGYWYYKGRHGLVQRVMVDGVAQYRPHTETACKRNQTVSKREG